MTRRAGFTLVEMIVSLTITTIIVSAVASVSVVMLRVASLDQGSSTSTATATRSVMDQIQDDLALATSIPEQSATALTVVVPDRDGDSLPETIRYAWSGVAGDPLTREYNGSSATAIASNITSLSFQHTQATRAATAATRVQVESTEQVLASCDSSGTISEHGIKINNSTSQYFKPALPSNAVSWKITRIKFQIRRNGNSSSDAQFDVMTADPACLPTGSALDSGTAAITTMGTNQSAWVEVAYSKLGSLDPGIGLCIVTKGQSASVSYYSRYSDTTLPIPAAFATRTNNGNWSTATSAKSIQFYVYGTVTTEE